VGFGVWVWGLGLGVEIGFRVWGGGGVGVGVGVDSAAKVRAMKMCEQKRGGSSMNCMIGSGSSMLKRPMCIAVCDAATDAHLQVLYDIVCGVDEEARRNSIERRAHFRRTVHVLLWFGGVMLAIERLQKCHQRSSCPNQTKPNQTKPNQTKPNQTSPNPPQSHQHT